MATTARKRRVFTAQQRQNWVERKRRSGCLVVTRATTWKSIAMATTTTRVTDPELIETGEKRDALGRRRTPTERRAELLAAYQASG